MDINKKRKAVATIEKFEIIKSLESGIKKHCDLAKEYGISENTVYKIWNKRDKIKEECKDNLNLDKKRFTHAKYKEIEDCLYDWFVDKRKLMVPLNGPILLSKADDFAKLLQIPDFKSNNGWLQRFKERYNLSKQKICGEKGDVDTDVVTNWIDKILPTIVNGYDPSCIYNCDETALFYKMLPEYTFNKIGEQAFGEKKSKERITVLFCCNMDGSDKVLPFVIGKSKKPRVFNGVKQLPVRYDNSNNA
jgi:hypothetical protein